MRQLLTTLMTADQVVAWLLTYMLHSTLLLGAAWAIARSLGGRRLRLQETIWRFALAGALVTATAQLALGGLGHAPLAGRWAVALASGPEEAVPSASRSRLADNAPGRDPQGQWASVRSGAGDSSSGLAAATLVAGPGRPTRAADRAEAAVTTGAARATRTGAGGVTAQEAATPGTARIGAAGRAGNARMGQTPSNAGLTLVDGVARRGGISKAAGVVGTSGLAEPAPAAGPRSALRTSTLAFTSVAAPKGSGLNAGARLSKRGGTLASSLNLARLLGALAQLLVPAWLLGALVLILGYLRSYRLLRRQLRCRLRVVGGAVVGRLAALARESGISRRVRLTCTWRLRVPVALSDGGAEVCVPPRALFELSDERQDALLAHELAHLARRDTLWLPLTGLLVAVFFFQPLNWLARRRLRDLSELLCDEWAVARTGSPLSLAGCLAEVAGWSLAALGGRAGAASLLSRRSAAGQFVPGMADRPSQLAHRIRRLLEGGPREERGPSDRRLAVLLASGLLAVILAAPGISATSSPAADATQPAPAITPKPTPPAASATPVGAVTARPAQQPGGWLAVGAAIPGSAPFASPTPAVPGMAIGAPILSGGPAGEVILAAPGLPLLGDLQAALAVSGAAPATAPAPVAQPAGEQAPLATSAEACGAPDAPAACIGTAPPAAATGSAGPTAPVTAITGTAPAPSSAAPSPVPRDLSAERARLAAAVAQLGQLDKLSVLSNEQLEALSAAADRISREIDGRLAQTLEDLDHQAAAARTARPRLPGASTAKAGGAAGPGGPEPPAAELAELDAGLADLAGRLRPSAADLAQLDAALRQLATLQPQLSAAEIEHIQKEAHRALEQLPDHGLDPAELDRIRADVRRSLEQLPKLHLSQAEIDQLRGDMRRALEESAAARAHALSPADRGKIEADAHRLASQLHPDQVQLEALRGVERERQELVRQLASERTEIEAMRREVRQQTEALREKARRLVESRRAHPSPDLHPHPAPSHPAPAAPAKPAAPAAPSSGSAPAAPASGAAPAKPAAPPVPDAAAPPSPPAARR